MTDRDCSVPGCPHVHDVQCLLMSIASGGLQRTRHHERRLPGGTVVIDEAFDEWPGLWAELQTTIARLSRSGGSSAGGKASETPVPYHDKASAVAHRMRNELSTWVRIVVDSRPDDAWTWPADNPPAIARWLAGHLAGMFISAELGSGIRGVVRDAERVIDQAPDRMFVGRCETPFTEEGRAAVAKDPNADVPRCVADLYVRAEAEKPAKRAAGAKDGEAKPKGFVSCRSCGAIHDVAYRKQWMATHLSGSLVTAGEAAPYLSWLTGKAIKVDTIHKWRTRAGRVESQDDRAGQPLYRFRDLLALAQEVKTRNAKPRGKEGTAA